MSPTAPLFNIFGYLPTRRRAVPTFAFKARIDEVVMSAIDRRIRFDVDSVDIAYYSSVESEAHLHITDIALTKHSSVVDQAL